MFIKKIMIGLTLLTIATAGATTGASGNAPGGAHVQCNGSYSSPVRCSADSW
jgi:hypothetical protein